MASCGKLYTSCIVSAPALCGHLVDSTPVKSWREPFKHCVQQVHITESLVGHLLQSHRGGVHVHQQPRAMWLDKEALRDAGRHGDDQWGQADADGASSPIYQVRVGSHQSKSNSKAKIKGRSATNNTKQGLFGSILVLWEPREMLSRDTFVMT